MCEMGGALSDAFKRSKKERDSVGGTPVQWCVNE